MVRLLTDEQLAEVDKIIKDEENVDIDYVYNGEDSLPQENAMGSLVIAAQRVREYLASLEVIDVQLAPRLTDTEPSEIEQRILREEADILNELSPFANNPH